MQAGILIQVSGAQVNDKWRWRYYRLGNVLAADCFFKIVPAGTQGNTSGVTALISNCSPTGALFTTGNRYPAGCPCAFDYIGGGFLISGTTSAGYPGTWTGTIDYTDPSNVTTPAVVQGQVYLVRTPLVAVLHGFNSDCGGVNDLVSNLASQLEIASNRVRCFGYAWQDGVRAGADGLGAFLTETSRLRSIPARPK